MAMPMAREAIGVVCSTISAMAGSMPGGTQLRAVAEGLGREAGANAIVEVAIKAAVAQARNFMIC